MATLLRIVLAAGAAALAAVLVANLLGFHPDPGVTGGVAGAVGATVAVTTRKSGGGDRE